MKWTQWLQGCSESWKNDGMTQTNIGKQVNTYLLKVEKNWSDNFMHVASRSWELYKRENIIKHKNMNAPITFNQSDLETLIAEAMNEASTFDLRGWYLPIELDLATNEYLKPSWTNGNGYTPGFLTVCKVGMFDPEGENIPELIEIHLGNAQNNIENYFAVQKGTKVVWI
jgi:hypothetical protein